MTRENLQWLAIALIVGSLITITNIMVRQSEQLVQLSRSLNVITKQIDDKAATTKPPQPVPITNNGGNRILPLYITVSQKNVTWNKSVFNFIHRCKGEIEVAEGQSTPFCIGENQLIVVNPAAYSALPQTILDTRTITTAKDAPVLIETELIEPEADTYSLKTKAVALISYATEPCRTTNACEIGMPNNHVTYSYDIADPKHSFVTLKNYPEYGRLIWNSNLTKAIVFPFTCGGAGCDTAILTGYDATTGSTKNLTKEKGAGDSFGDARGYFKDASGEKIVYWSVVEWIDDTHFEAQLVNPDGTKKIVSGQF